MTHQLGTSRGNLHRRGGRTRYPIPSREIRKILQAAGNLVLFRFAIERKRSRRRNHVFGSFLLRMKKGCRNHRSTRINTDIGVGWFIRNRAFKTQVKATNTSANISHRYRKHFTNPCPSVFIRGSDQWFFYPCRIHVISRFHALSFGLRQAKISRREAIPHND